MSRAIGKKGIVGSETIDAALKGEARSLVDHYRLAMTAASRSGNQLSVEALDYQAERASEAASRLTRPGCLVLQDPTGTGKTVVALVASMLLLSVPDDRGVNRVLVVAPNQNVGRLWAYRAKAVGFADSDVKTQISGRLSWSQDYRLMIATRASMPDKALPLAERERLLIVVDEAHRGMEDSDSDTFDRISDLAADGRVLLVTATPFQLSASGLAQMLEIATRKAQKAGALQLDRNAIELYGEALVAVLQAARRLSQDPSSSRLKLLLDEANQREEAARPRKDATLAGHMMSAFDAARIGMPKPVVPHVHQSEIEPTIDWRTFYHVARILPEFTAADQKAQSSDSYVRMLGSSHEAFRDTHVLNTFAIANSASPLVDALERATSSEATMHPKVEATARWVADRLAMNRHVLVFCVFKATQKGLVEAIRTLLPNGADVAQAETAAQATQLHRRQFCFPAADGVRPLALVVRDNLSEAIDLDGGEPCVVHHDLTWNPARFAQRMGRITRASSNFWTPALEDIFIPVLNLGLDQRLYHTMMNRAQLADQVVSASQGIELDRIPSDIVEVDSKG
jgi:superfamily II DNA or RNA helicase